MTGELAQAFQSASNLPGSTVVRPGSLNFSPVHAPSFSFFSGFVHDINVLFSFASLFFILVIIFVIIQRNVVLAYDKSLYKPSSKSKEDGNDGGEEDNGHDESELSENTFRPRFEEVQKHLDGENPAQWKMAIIEADNILYEILKRAEFRGETLGEMLTNANTVSFQTLECAWEAHKTRNVIAHGGEQFPLTQREARRVMGLYERIFREFSYL